MARTLVIKNADFSANKIDTVEFVQDIPCTAISLNKSTESITSIGGTKSLTATVTPANTTDEVMWTTSDDEVADIAGGVITAIGCGTATITATCGSHSATCTVTVTNVLEFDYLLASKAMKAWGDAKDFTSLIYNSTPQVAYAGLYNGTTQTAYKVHNDTNGQIQGTNLWPIPFGKGATTLVATVPDTMRITMWFTDCDTLCTYGESHAYNPYAKFISGDASEYDSSVAVGNRTMTIPTGANSAVFTLQKTGSGAEISAEDVAAVTITAVGS